LVKHTSYQAACFYFSSVCLFSFGPGGNNQEQHEEWWGWKNENQTSTWKLTGAKELQQLNDDINYIGNNYTYTKGQKINAGETELQICKQWGNKITLLL